MLISNLTMNKILLKQRQSGLFLPRTRRDWRYKRSTRIPHPLHPCCSYFPTATSQMSVNGDLLDAFTLCILNSYLDSSICHFSPKIHFSVSDFGNLKISKTM